MILRSSGNVPAIDVGDMITLDGVTVDFTVGSLTAALGPPRDGGNHIDDGRLFWDLQGIEARVCRGVLREIVFALTLEESEDASRHGVWDSWIGDTLVDRKPFHDASVRLEGVGGDVSYARASSARFFVTAMWPNRLHGPMGEVTITRVPPQRRDVDPAAYAITECHEPVVTFTSWTFKLAVVQVLMYREMVLEPRFDIDDFAEVHSARRIEPEWEGMHIGIIPEAADWFWRLPVPVRLAPLITSLDLEGGEEVYAHLWPLWDGESDEFTISADGAELDQFPSLARLTKPTCVTPATLQLVADRGWDVGEGRRELRRQPASTPSRKTTL